MEFLEDHDPKKRMSSPQKVKVNDLIMNTNEEDANKKTKGKVKKPSKPRVVYFLDFIES